MPNPNEKLQNEQHPDKNIEIKKELSSPREELENLESLIEDTSTEVLSNEEIKNRILQDGGTEEDVAAAEQNIAPVNEEIENLVLKTRKQVSNFITSSKVFSFLKNEYKDIQDFVILKQIDKKYKNLYKKFQKIDEGKGDLDERQSRAQDFITKSVSDEELKKDLLKYINHYDPTKESAGFLQERNKKAGFFVENFLGGRVQVQNAMLDHFSSYVWHKKIIEPLENKEYSKVLDYIKILQHAKDLTDNTVDRNRGALWNVNHWLSDTLNDSEITKILTQRDNDNHDPYLTEIATILKNRSGNKIFEITTSDSFPVIEQLKRILVELVEMIRLSEGVSIEEANKKLPKEFGAYAAKALNKFITAGNMLSFFKIISSIKELESYTNSNISLKKIHEQIPWSSSIEKLLHTQKRVTRQEYDPWLTDLSPLVKNMIEKKILDAQVSKDGELVDDFVQRMGMKNLPTYFELFSVIKRSPSVAELSEGTKKEIKEHFNIDSDKVCKGDPKNMNLIINEIEKYCFQLEQDFKNENEACVDKALSSKYAIEFLDSIKGISGHKQGGTTEEALKTYKKTISKSPELFKVPEGYERTSFELKERTLLTDENLIKNIEEEKKKVLSNKQLKITFTQFNEILQAVKLFQIKDQIPSIKNLFEKEFELQLQNTQKRLLDEKEKVPPNEKAIIGFNKKLESIQIQQDAFQKTKLENSSSIVQVLEYISATIPDSFTEKKQVLLMLSFQDMKEKLPQQYEMLTDGNIDFSNPSEHSISVYSEFLNFHIREHYLDKKHGEEQAINTTDKELIKALKAAWDVKDYDNNIVGISNKKLNLLERGELSDKVRSITAIPSRGLQRVFSGDLGQACTSRKNIELAQGKYPGITSYSLVLDEGKPQERFVGSFLIIEAETLKKEPCLVLRANNPAQNLFSMVDGDTLIKNIIGELKNVAARKGIKNTVVTMLEGSDSNRDEIKDYYKKHYSEQMISKIVPDNEDPTKFIDKNKKIMLRKSPETQFNGYDITSQVARV